MASHIRRKGRKEGVGHGCVPERKTVSDLPEGSENSLFFRMRQQSGWGGGEKKKLYSIILPPGQKNKKKALANFFSDLERGREVSEKWGGEGEKVIITLNLA